MTKEERQKLFDGNLAKISELQDRVQWAGRGFLAACWFRELHFKITEAYRTQDRQNALYAQGRWKPGKVVTWTLKSLHVQRLAIDVYPVDCSYQQLEDVAKLFGITHPLKFDLPHFQFDLVGDAPVQAPPLKTQLANVLKALKRFTTGLRHSMLLRKKERLEDAIEEEEASV